MDPVVGNNVIGKLLAQTPGVGRQWIIDVSLDAVCINDVAEVARPQGRRRHVILDESGLAVPQSLIGGKPESLVAAVVPVSEIQRTAGRGSKFVPDQLG